MIREFTVYLFERSDVISNKKGWTLVMDTTDSGLSNIDLEYCYFIIGVIQNEYVGGVKHMLVIDLPLTLSLTAKLIMSFMNKDLQTITNHGTTTIEIGTSK